MKRIPLIVSALVVLAGLVLVGLAWRAQRPAIGPQPHFNLVDTAGRTVGEGDLRGSAALVYFGYTFCPDICPTELGWMVRVLRELGPEAQHVKPVFVSVDPERDTPTKLKDYAALFDARLLALTGTPEALHAAGDAFGATWRKAEVVTQQPGYYLIDHSMATYLLDREGRIVARIQSHDTTPAAAAALIRSIL